MKKKLMTGLMTGLFLLGFIEMANALTIDTYASQESIFSSIPIDSDSATSGTVTSAAKDLYGYTTATSKASDNGDLYAEVTNCDSIDFFDRTASASWSETIFNNTLNTMNYELDFSLNGWLNITGFTLHIQDMSTMFAIDILANGTSIWNSSVNLKGALDEEEVTGVRIHTSDITTSGTDLGGAFSRNDYNEDLLTASYLLPSYSDLLSIGSLLPGEAFSLKYIITVDGTGCDVGVLSTSVLNMSGDLLSSPEPVPEPATMLLFGTGIAALAGSRVRQKKE